MKKITFFVIIYVFLLTNLLAQTLLITDKFPSLYISPLIHGIRQTINSDLQLIASKDVSEIKKYIYYNSFNNLIITNNFYCTQLNLLSVKYNIVCITFQSNIHDNITKIIIKLNLEKLWNFLQANHTFIDNIYILSEPPYSMTDKCYNLLTEYRKQLYNKNVEIYYIKTKDELITILKQLNKKEFGLIIPVMFRLYDNNKKLNRLSIIRTIIRYNYKHLELGDNEQLCKYGLSICISPTYYYIGSIIGDIVNKLEDGDKVSNIIIPECKLLVNDSRLKQLHFLGLLSNIYYIDEIYTTIPKLDNN